MTLKRAPWFIYYSGLISPSCVRSTSCGASRGLAGSVVSLHLAPVDSLGTRYTQTLLAVRLSGAHCSARLVARKATRHSLQLFLTVAGKMLGLFAVAKNKTQHN